MLAICFHKERITYDLSKQYLQRVLIFFLLAIVFPQHNCKILGFVFHENMCGEQLNWCELWIGTYKFWSESNGIIRNEKHEYVDVLWLILGVWAESKIELENYRIRCCLI